MPVNPNEAPEGFIAVESSDDSCCDGCHLTLADDQCLRSECVPDARDDACLVIFVQRTDKPATANFPHDDMGTPV